MKVNARSRPIPCVSQTKEGQVLLSVSWEMFVLGPGGLATQVPPG